VKKKKKKKKKLFGRNFVFFVCFLLCTIFKPFDIRNNLNLHHFKIYNFKENKGFSVVSDNVIFTKTTLNFDFESFEQ